MPSSTIRLPRALATLIASIVLALSATLVFVPDARADNAMSLTEKLATTLSDCLISAKSESFLDESRAGDFYFAQNGSGRCTITSTAMMVRRAAFLDSRPDWQSVTVESVTANGWVSAGVKHHFETAGYSVGIVDLDGTHEGLAQLLEQHPEGIAAYDTSVPHAVLITDYDEETGVFYCADPAGHYAGKRIPVSESWNGAVKGHDQTAVVTGFSRAWVIAKADL